MAFYLYPQSWIIYSCPMLICCVARWGAGRKEEAVSARGPGLLRPRNCCSNVSWTVARRWAGTRCARTPSRQRAEWKTFGIWKSWDVKRRICAKSNKIIRKAGVGLMSTVPQDGHDDRHVNDDPSSPKKSLWDQKTVNISDISRKAVPCYADIQIPPQQPSWLVYAN